MPGIGTIDCLLFETLLYVKIDTLVLNSMF